MNTSRNHATWGHPRCRDCPPHLSRLPKRRSSPKNAVPVNQVLEWNQIFIDTLIATNTANSSSQRLGAIVHTAIFDAYNGIERRYTPIFVRPHRASWRVAPGGGDRCGIHRARRPLPVLAQLQRAALDASYAASLAALSDDGGDGGQSRERGIAWGTEVAQAVLAWRATDGFIPPPILRSAADWRSASGGRRGGSCVAMSALGLAFTSTVRRRQHDPVRSRTTARSGQPHLRRRFQQRQGARSQTRDRRAPTTRRRSRRSGRATPACTGTRRRTRLRAQTTCRCPRATGCSRC